MVREVYDSIVVGVGGMGSSVVHKLAERGQDVLGIERHDLLHSQGSSHGASRMIRRPYPKHPAYVPLLERSYELWRQLEKDRQQLLYTTGSVHVGPSDGVFVAEIENACIRQGISYDKLTGGEVSGRYPAFQIPDGYEAVYQPDGGFIWPDRSIVAHVEEAAELGAEFRFREPVKEWRQTNDGIVVRTDSAEYLTESLVISAGAFFSDLTDIASSRLRPERQVLGWFMPDSDSSSRFARENLPVFQVTDDEHYYGFPKFQLPGIKIGLHHHLREDVDPSNMADPTSEDERLLRQFVEKYFAAGSLETLRLETCLYTNTPSEDFIIDFHPDHGNVVLAGGFSGHGFKFCPAVGEIVADLVMSADTSHDIELFALDSDLESGSTVGLSDR